MAELAIQEQKESERASFNGFISKLDASNRLLSEFHSEGGHGTDAAGLQQKHKTPEAVGILPNLKVSQADFSTVSSPTIYAKSAIQAVDRLPHLAMQLFEGPYDSATKLNIQITNVPDVSVQANAAQLLNYFETTTATGAKSIRGVEQHLAHSNAINDDLNLVGKDISKYLAKVASNPEQPIEDAIKFYPLAGQALGDALEKLDKPMSVNDRAKTAGMLFPLFFLDGEPISPKVAKQLGIEKISAENWESMGITSRRVDIKLDADGFSYKATCTEDPKLLVRIQSNQVGVLEVTDIFSGKLPRGSGGELLAATLKGHHLVPSKGMVIKNIVDPTTIAAFKAGVPASDSLLGRCAANAYNSLGIEAKSYTWQTERGKLEIVIETK